MPTVGESASANCAMANQQVHTHQPQELAKLSFQVGGLPTSLFTPQVRSLVDVSKGPGGVPPRLVLEVVYPRWGTERLIGVVRARRRWGIRRHFLGELQQSHGSKAKSSDNVHCSGQGPRSHGRTHSPMSH
jgi:hypothetical protein